MADRSAAGSDLLPSFSRPQVFGELMLPDDAVVGLVRMADPIFRLIGSMVRARAYGPAQAGSGPEAPGPVGPFQRPCKPPKEAALNPVRTSMRSMLLPVGQLHRGTSETHGIERDNARQPHGRARFRRRSIVVSKARRMVDVSIALFARCAGNNRIGDFVSMLA